MNVIYHIKQTVKTLKKNPSPSVQVVQQVPSVS